MECVGFLAQLFVENLRRLRGIDDEKAARSGIFKNMLDESFVVQGSEVRAFNPVESFEKSRFVSNDGSDFVRWDANVKSLAPFESGLGRGAKDDGGVEVVDEATEPTEDGMEQSCGQSLNFVENHNAAGDAMELAAGAGAIGEERFKELNVRRDDEGGGPVLGGEAIGFRLFFGVELGVMLEDDIATKLLGK